MPRELAPKRRFILMLLVIFVVSLPVISGLTYLVLKEDAIRDAYSAAKLHLSTIEAVRHYVATELRPALYRDLSGKFVLEGMSRSYAANTIAREVHEKYPGYRYKNAVLSAPMNPMNGADEFEKKIITLFTRDRELREWQGLKIGPEGSFYVLARPGEPFNRDCLYCHGDPATAPVEILRKYGTSGGFNRKAGELLDAKFVYIPIDVPLASARKAVAIFIGIYVVFGFTILSVIHVRFTKLYDRIEADKRRIEDINLELLNLNEDMESIIAERTMNLIALSVADRVRNPATVIAGTFNRILRKETIPDPLRERLVDLMTEAQKLDAIVKDYETILRSKKVMFRGEDMNEIIGSTLPFIEGDRKSRGVALSLKLSDSPAWFIANRQLLRVAVVHILKNAIEATPEGGRITVETDAREDRVFLTIADTGRGIPPEDVPKIFSLFYSTKKHRIGMGLPLVKQIVTEHKGTIEVESDPGRGTTFRLAFPVRWSEQGLSGKGAPEEIHLL